MSNNSDYLDRLKNIREKYGCSQPKIHAGLSETSLGMNRGLGMDRPGSAYLKNDLYTLEKTKMADNMYPPTTKYAENVLTSGTLGSKNIDFSMRPQTGVGLASQSYNGVGDFSRRTQRQRQIQQIRENYAASRKKVIEDFSAKNYTRDYSKQLPKDYSKDYMKDYAKQYPKQYLKGSDYLKDYTRPRREEFDIPVTAHKIDLLGHAEESVSPIKRMNDLQEKKSYRYKQPETSDTFWRQRQAKLSQLTANRLNQNRDLTTKDQKIIDSSKLYQVKRSGMYNEPTKTYSQAPSFSRKDLENKPGQYSVNNIDRIQQRIQSILGKK